MRREHVGILVILVLGVAVLGSSILTRYILVRAAGTTVTIPGDYSRPAAIMIEVGQTITWVNKDSDPHVTTTVPGAPATFTLATEAGKSSSFKFSKPGVYGHYCLDHATYNPKLHRVVARKQSDSYPLAMEGLVVVKGPGFTGAPSATVRLSGGLYAPDWWTAWQCGRTYDPIAQPLLNDGKSREIFVLGKVKPNEVSSTAAPLNFGYEDYPHLIHHPPQGSKVKPVLSVFT